MAGRPRIERAEAVSTERRRRKDSSLDTAVAQKLSLPREYKEDPDYDYRWVNDRGDRITTLFDRDWDLVHTGNSEASNEDRVSRVVGEIAPGKPLMAHLMRKRKEYVAEDQAAKVDRAESLLQNQTAPPKSEVEYAVSGNSIKNVGYAP